MDKNPYAPDFKDLPDVLPVFPLDGVLLLPTGRLPLNIFEERYLRMFDDAMAGNRMIGMVQPKDVSGESGEIYKIGCAGKIVEFSETPDGRYVVTLNGVSRFRVRKEIGAKSGYRRVKANWNDFEADLAEPHCLDLDRDRLHALLGAYFEAQDMSCDWQKVEGATDGRLITCLSMICPFSAQEKQALLEAPCCRTRSQTFMAMLEMAVQEEQVGRSCGGH